MTKTEEQYVEQMNIEEVFRAVEAEVADVDKLECFEQHYDAVAPLVKRFLHLEYNDLSRVDQCTWLLLFLAHCLLQREHWKLMNQIPTGESDLVRK